MRLAKASAALALGLAASSMGCVLKSAEDPAGAPRVLSVQVASPTTTTLPGVPVRLHATVLGTGAVPQGVLWRAEGGGSVTPEGVFVYAQNPASTARVEVVATSVAAPRISDRARIDVLHADVTVGPATVDVVYDQGARFSAQLNGEADPSIEWSAERGTIDATGAYRAPASYSGLPTDVVTARSAATGVSGVATVRFRVPPPSLAGDPPPVLPGATMELQGAGFTGQGIGGTVEVIFPDLAGGTVAAAPAIVTFDRLQVVVPETSSDGPLRVRRLPSLHPAETSDAVQFTRVPRLRVRADRFTLAAGETARIAVAFLGSPLSWPLDFTTDRGTVTGAVYTAPSDVAEPGLASVRVCAAGTASCSGVTLELVPIRVEPWPAVVKAGETIALTAYRAGAAVPATFSLRSGEGSITPDGLFSAPASVTAASTTWLVATDGSIAVDVPVSIRDVVRGLVGWLERNPGDSSDPLRAGARWGANVQDVAASGTRAFTVSSRDSSPWERWIDEFDLTDPRAPVWVGAVELGVVEAAWSQIEVARGYLYVPTIDRPSTFGDWKAVFRVYDLSTSPPSFAGRLDSSGSGGFIAPPVVDGDRLYEFGPLDATTGEIPVSIRDLSAGPFSAPRLVRLPPPPDDPSHLEYMGRAATARDGRAWATYRSSLGWTVAAWDLGSDPPVYLGSVRPGFGAVPFRLVVRGPYLFSYQYWCFDRTPPVPVFLGCSESVLRAVDGTRAVQAGPSLLDLSDPSAPVVLVPSLGGTEESFGALVGDLFYGSDGVFDLGTGATSPP